MKRSKKIVLLAHCILNTNAKVDGLSTEAAGCTKIVAGLLDNGYGIIQLPCVEQSCLGMKRWGIVKDQLDFPGFRAKCRSLLQPIIEQVVDFSNNGYTIAAVIGVDGSPTCGVNYTCSGNWGGEIGEGYSLADKIASLVCLPESGIMIEVLQQMLKEVSLSVKFIAVDEKNPQSAIEDLIKNLS